MAKNEFVDIGARRHSRHILVTVECANGRGNLNSDDDIVNVTVLVLLHSRSTGADPSTQSGELHRIGFVTAHNSEFRELLFEIFTDDTCLNACHHVRLVNPFDSVHARHVY